MREYKGRSLLDFPESYAVVDIETTGLDPARDHIIEIGAIKIADGSISDTFSTLINPGVQIDSFITDLTGIANQDLISAPEPEHALSDFCDFIGDSILVGHNVHFDINFLYDAMEQYLHKYLGNNFVDTMRLSKKYFRSAPSYKLTELARFLDIPVNNSHRALDDCKTTYHLYQKLQEASLNPTDVEQSLLETLVFDESNPFYNKRIAVKGLPQLYSYAFMKEVSSKCQASMSDIFYSSCDYIIFSNYTYQRYKRGEISEKFEKANRLADAGTLTILSEEDWCKMLGIPIPKTNKSHPSLSAKDIVTTRTEFDETHPLYGKLCVFTGTLEKMQRKDAMQIVVDLGGQVGNSVTKKTNFLILGNNDYCPLIKDGKSSKQKKAEALKLAGNDIEIISEDVFYDMISEE